MNCGNWKTLYLMTISERNLPGKTSSKTGSGGLHSIELQQESRWLQSLG
ncbi:hypothetical protein [Chamaesiphon minutus]|nr:hypothetical protein [Chamaesiphon minutus]